MPSNADARLSLADLLLAQNKYAEAEPEYLAFLASHSDFAAAHLNVADVLMKLGRFDQAATHAAEASRLNPTDATSHNVRGAALASQGHLDEAIPEFQKALELDAGNVQAQNNLTKAQQLTGGRR